MQGGSGVLFSYVVRSINYIHPKLSVDDLVTSYATHDEDMFKRAPIIAAVNPLGMEEDGPFSDYFIADIGKLRDILSPLIIKTEAWTHIKRTRTSRDSSK